MAQSVEELIKQAVKQAASGSDHASQIADQVGTLHTATTYMSWGVLLLGLVLLILKEIGSSEEPRLWPIFLKFGFIVLLLLEYQMVVRVITGLAGGTATWAKQEQLFGWLNDAEQAFGYRFDGLGDIPEMILWLLLLGFLLLGSVLAYVVSLALSMSQGILIAIALSVGKFAIAVSLVPGVSVGKGWARFLAMTAAWSRIGIAIIGLMKLSQSHVYGMVVGDSALGIMMLTGKYFVLAATLGATPWITAAIFNGVAAMAAGLPAMATSVWAMAGAGFIAGRQAAGTAGAGARGGVRGIQRILGKQGPAEQGGRDSGSARPHKLPHNQRPDPKPPRGGGPGGGNHPRTEPPAGVESSLLVNGTSPRTRAPAADNGGADSSRRPANDEADHKAPTPNDHSNAQPAVAHSEQPANSERAPRESEHPPSALPRPRVPEVLPGSAPPGVRAGNSRNSSTNSQESTGSSTRPSSGARPATAATQALATRTEPVQAKSHRSSPAESRLPVSPSVPTRPSERYMNAPEPPRAASVEQRNAASLQPRSSQTSSPQTRPEQRPKVQENQSSKPLSVRAEKPPRPRIHKTEGEK